MSKGIPLDLYLESREQSSADESLTDDQLNIQLTGSSSKIAGTSEGSKSTAPADDINDVLAAAIQHIDDREEERSGIDTAVKAASHGVKVLSPLLAAVSRWANPETEPEKVNNLIASVLGRVRNDASHVIAAYGVSPSDSPAWLTSQVSGQIMQLLINAIDRNNGAILEASDTRYLKPLIDHASSANGIADTFYSNPGNPQWQIVNAMMLAAADVMTEYHAFNYFHASASDISKLVTDLIQERVIEGTLNEITERFGLSDQERAYLGISLIRQAGRVLADAWANLIPETLEAIKDMPKEQRREAVLRGCPLDPILDQFESVYQGLEISAYSAMSTLAPSREQRQVKTHGLSS